MVCDFLFPAAWSCLALCSLYKCLIETSNSLVIQRSLKQHLMTTAVHKLHKGAKEEEEEKEEEEWGFNGILGDLLSEFVLADWDETADEG